MSLAQRDIDRRFSDIVGPPLDPTDFDHGGSGGHFPSWSTHVIAFLCGGITFTALVFAPLVAPVLFVVALAGFIAVAVKSRWR